MNTLRRRLALLRDPRRRDAGVTMVEVLVVMGLSLLVLTMTTTFFTQVTRTTTTAQDRRDNTAQAANAMNAIGAYVRAATRLNPDTTPVEAIVSAQPEYLEFYSFTSSNGLSPAPIRVRIWIDSSRNLNIRSWATTSATSASTTQRYEGYLAPSPNLGAGEAYLFTYFDANGVQLGGSGTLSASDAAKVRGIQVSVRLREQGVTTVDPVTIQTRIVMPNLGISQGTT
ncbi:MAG: prepilin-type N-terminal cleavage/methylation domain-containing protein [Actinomycetales bacterium]|nr:prepilin-type N-terminal cleavage/methylation domain-containing protein [Actinomycetales bacterium]